jgi:AcrR family transcriptional regulator
MLAPAAEAAANPMLPRDPQRARGRLRYEKLLDAAASLLGNGDGSTVTLNDAATLAGVPLASVYHYFPSNTALLVGLARRYFRDFEDLMDVRVPHSSLRSWTDLCRAHAAAGRHYYERNTSAMRLLLGAGFGAPIRQSDLAANLRFASAQYHAYNRHFVMPTGDYPVEHCAVAITISDSIWSLSYNRHGRITDALAEEALAARLAYLRLYLPERAEKRLEPLSI